MADSVCRGVITGGGEGCLIKLSKFGSVVYTVSSDSGQRALSFVVRGETVDVVANCGVVLCCKLQPY